MQRGAALYLLSFLMGLSVVAVGCAGEEPPAAGDELAIQGATVVSGTSKVTLCNLPRYTKQTTVRLCGYVTPGTDGSAVVSAWFSVDGGAAIAVVPGSGGFVDTSTSLAEGAHSIRLYARSAAGNLTFEEKPVTVDATPPILKVLSPTSADVMTSTVVNVTSSVSDATAVRVQTQWVQSSTVDSGVGTVTHTVDLVNLGYNTLLVRATDAVGNTSETRVTVYFCPSSDAACFASAHWAPVIVSTYPSATTVPASDGVTFRVEASDPQNSPLSFSWAANVGSLGTATSGATTSEALWTAPACLPTATPPAVTVTVTNALGLSTTTSFSLTGGTACPKVASRVATGSSTTLALTADGTVWAWGYNYHGELGDGTTSYRTTPGPVQGLTGVATVSGLGYFTVALKTDGTVWAWGRNNWGQLGDGTTNDRLTPVQVQGLTGVAAISAGGGHTVALKKDGTLWAWGRNTSGELGDGTTNDRLTPVQVRGLAGAVAIAAGGYYTVALHADGTVWAWGGNGIGELGDGTTTNRSTPVQVQGLTNVVAIDTVNSHTVALKKDGTLWAWGYNMGAELGDGTSTNRSTPGLVPGLTGVTAFAVGSYHTLALRTDGTVWAWGSNGFGQIGDGTTTFRLTPGPVQGLTGIAAIDCGSYYTVALKTDGTVWAWGSNNWGQLGDGTTNDHLTPVRVQGFSN